VPLFRFLQAAISAKNGAIKLDATAPIGEDASLTVRIYRSPSRKRAVAKCAGNSRAI
jgi:hypothetical protein